MLRKTLLPAIWITNVLIILLIPSIAFGQAVTSLISGKVLNKEGEELPGITVLVEGVKGKGTATDINGNFTITGVKAGSYILLVSGIGYVGQKKPVDLKEGQQLMLDFTMEASTTELESVTVLGKNVLTQTKEQAFEVAVINAKKLHNTTLDLGHALDRVAGVRVRESGGVGSRMNISLNGFNGRQIKFFIDGVPMENFGSSFQLNNIPVNLADRIEIYKGVVPVWLGSDALGGAINIVTNQKLQTYLDASYSYGSFNTHRSAINAGYTARSGFTVQLNAFQNYSDNNYRVNVDVSDLATGKYFPDQRVRRFHDTYHNETVIAKLGVVDKKYADQLLVGITLGRNYSEIQTGARLVSVFGDVHHRGNTIMPGLKYRKSNFITSGLDLSLNANYNFGTEQNIDTVHRRYNWFGDYKQYEGEGSERSRSLYKYRNNNGVLTANLNYRIDGKHSVTINHVYNTFDRKGRDELYPENDSYEQPRKSTKNITGLGYKLDLHERWSSTVFLKHYAQVNRYSQLYQPAGGGEAYRKQKKNFTSVGYGAIGTYFIAPNLQLKASYEKSYRLPETEELYGDMVNLEGNIDLDPETSHNVNLGLNYSTSVGKHHDLSFGGNIFYRNARDFIRRRLNRNQARLTMDNLARVTNVGVDGQLRYSFQKLFTAGVNLTYQNLRNNTRYEGDQTTESIVYRDRIPNQPYLFGNADMSVFLNDVWKEDNTLTLGYNLLYVHAFYLYWPSLGSEKFDIPGQVSHDVNLTYSMENGKYNVTLESRNLADAVLYDNFSLQKPGRSFTVKLRYFISK